MSSPGTSRLILIKMAKIQDKQRILKAARERKQIIFKGTPKGYLLTFQQKLCITKGNVMIYLE